MSNYFLKVILFFILPISSQAYVENITHGYPTCLACHSSPTGGNMLTDYGRSLSKELMSTWGGWKNSEQPLFGAVKNLESIKLGGDIRNMQTYRETDEFIEGTEFVMQSNLELGVPYKKIMLIGTIGTQEGPTHIPERGRFVSERHYLLWQTSPTSRVRVGKYRQRFGLNDPNHTRQVKSLFGFGAQSETYNLDYTQLFESYEFTLGASFGRLNDFPRDSEKNISFTFAHYLKGKSRLGTSFLFGETDVSQRWLVGVFGITPLTSKIHFLFEFDYERAIRPSDVTTFASQTRLGYQIFKGFLSYLVLESSAIERVNLSEFYHAPGVGFQWLPFPHIEFHLEYQKRKATAQNQSHPTHFGWIQLHMYPF